MVARRDICLYMRKRPGMKNMPFISRQLGGALFLSGEQFGGGGALYLPGHISGGRAKRLGIYSRGGGIWQALRSKANRSLGILKDMGRDKLAKEARRGIELASQIASVATDDFSKSLTQGMTLAESAKYAGMRAKEASKEAADEQAKRLKKETLQTLANLRLQGKSKKVGAGKRGGAYEQQLGTVATKGQLKLLKELERKRPTAAPPGLSTSSVNKIQELMLAKNARRYY